jgi:hypothetical protein
MLLGKDPNLPFSVNVNHNTSLVSPSPVTPSLLLRPFVTYKEQEVKKISPLLLRMFSS